MKHEVSKIKRSKGRGRLAVAGLVVAAAVILAVANPAWVHARLVALNLAPAPERYTELYFTQHLLLPTVVGTGPVAFSFTIHNVEGADTNYPYAIVLMQPNGTSQTLAVGQVTLANGQARNLPVAFKLPAGVSKAEVAIVLPVQQESIHFWLGAQS